MLAYVKGSVRRRAGNEDAWWSRLASSLLIASAGGARPRGVTAGSMITASRFAACYQASLRQVDCVIYRDLAASDERVYDVVWRELRSRAARRRLEFRV